MIKYILRNLTNMKKTYKKEFLRIIQLQASEIVNDKFSLTIENTKEDFDSHFKELLPLNLDVLYLNSLGKLDVLELFDEQYTYDLVSVDFKNSPKKARESVYLKGFTLNGKNYVRYKRSAGSARSGGCLFIKKSLFNTMDKWSNCGLKFNECTKDLVSFESYKSLSLSSLIKTLSLNPYNILFVKDEEAILKNEKVVRVFVNEDEKLEAKEETCDITNKIWDGEGLLDKEVFKQAGFSSKGMMLLRNRFFKSCVFNTNLQEWFRENGIDEVSKLNGITFAKKVSDIKLVVTESSIKYIKLANGGFTKENLKRWCDEVSDENGLSLFGIVKTDKPSRYFRGDMIETTYQLLNTLHLTEMKVKSFINKNVDYIKKIRAINSSPEYLKLFLKGEEKSPKTYLSFYDDSEDIDEDDGLAEDVLDESLYGYKKLVCDTLLDVNRDILKTPTFKYFVYEETLDSLRMRMYAGRILVHGSYMTLFGNPYELLLNIINKFNGKSAFLHRNEISSTFFQNDVQVVGTRAPHVTMGNVLLAKNVKNKEVERWFNLTREIVIVDAIENNIQYRLNGADYDSDTVLLTDDEYLVDAASYGYDSKFLVPYMDIGHESNELETLNKKDKDKNLLLNYSKIDDKVANNNIGKIINQSQILNSYYWDILNSKNKVEKAKLPEIYREICKLAVLSNVEIDSAKRSFKCDSEEEQKRTKAFIDLLAANYPGAKGKFPLFFYKVMHKESGIGYVENHLQAHKGERFKTTMDFLWTVVYSTSLSGERIRNEKSFAELTKNKIPVKKSGGQQYGVVNNMIDKLVELKNDLTDYVKSDRYRSDEIKKKDFKHKVEKTVRKLKKHLGDEDLVRIAIKKLDKLERKKSQGKGKGEGFYANVFILFFYLIYYYQKHVAKKDPLAFKQVLFSGYEPVFGLRRTTKHAVYVLFDKYNYAKVMSSEEKLLSAIFTKKTTII